MTPPVLIPVFGEGGFCLLAHGDSIQELEREARSQCASLRGYAASITDRLCDAVFGGAYDPRRQWHEVFREEFPDEATYLQEHLLLPLYIMRRASEAETRLFLVGDMCDCGDMAIAAMFYGSDGTTSFDMLCGVFGWTLADDEYEDTNIVCDE